MTSSGTNAPMVSVVIPVYNGAATLREAVESVLAQTFADYELILVDDASTDGSPAIARSFGDRVRLVQRARNSGLCEVARSEGLALARGRYGALLDQDDLWAPDKLARQVAFMEARPELLLSHTYAWVMDAEGKQGGIRHEGLIPPTGPCARALLDHCFITISTIMVRGRAWLDAGEATSLKSANSDFLYFFSLLRKSPAGFGFLPEPLASYRRWPQGMSQGRWKWTPEDAPALMDLYRSGLWKGLVTRRQVRAAIARACLINAEHHYHQGPFGRVAYFVGQGWLRRPLDLRFPAWLVRAAAKRMARGILNPER
jgi:teichuronic acid biosynthesis glycosyltransferase TuaG